MTAAYAAALAFVLAGCAPRAPVRAAASDACSTRLTHGPVHGAIFSAACGPVCGPAMFPGEERKLVGYWQPTSEVIALLETRLRPVLELAHSKPETVVDLPRREFDREQMVWGVTTAIREILDHFADYRCQYLGIVVAGGARRVLANCFRAPSEVDDRTPDYGHKAWVNPFAMDDGGSDYWRIQYDVATCRFLEFDLNSSG